MWIRWEVIEGGMKGTLITVLKIRRGGMSDPVNLEDLTESGLNE